MIRACGTFEPLYALGKILYAIAPLTPEEARITLLRASTLNEARCPKFRKRGRDFKRKR